SPTHVCPRKDWRPFHLTRRPTLPSEQRRSLRQARGNRSRSHCKNRAHRFLRGTTSAQLIQFLIRSPFLSRQTASAHPGPSNARRHRSVLLLKHPRTIVVF